MFINVKLTMLNFMTKRLEYQFGAWFEYVQVHRFKRFFKILYHVSHCFRHTVLEITYILHFAGE